MARNKRAAIYRYPGELGKPSSFQLLEKKMQPAIAAGLLAGRDLEELRKDAFIAAYNRRQEEVLAALFRHFQIPEDLPTRWEALALNLVRRHVPAWAVMPVKSPGRPKKLFWKNQLVRIVGPRPRGRPKKASKEDWLREYLEALADYCQAFELHGRGAVTGAIRSGLQKRARATGKSLAWVRSELPKWQKDVSRAKHLFPEIAKKLPR